MDEFSVWCRAISPTFVPSTSQTLKLAACASASETSSSATGEPSLPTHYTHITHQHNTPSPPIAPPRILHQPNYTPNTVTMAQEDAAKRIEEAKKLSKDQPSKAEAIYKEILSQPPGTSDKAVREFETALLGLGELYRDHKRTQDLANLIQQTREVLDETSDVQQIYHNRARPDQNVWEHRAVNLPQISRHKRVFCNQLLLLELAIDQHDISIFIKLCTSQFEFRAGLQIPAS
jgi:hypothetical protein